MINVTFAFKVNYASTLQEGVYFFKGFFRCMLNISYSILEMFRDRRAWQIQSIPQTGRLAECFSTSMICSTVAVKGYDTETGDSVDSSDAPVIRSRLNQLELLTGIRMMIRILSYEDNY